MCRSGVVWGQDRVVDFRSLLQEALLAHGDEARRRVLPCVVVERTQGLDAPLASQCAATIDHLATYHFKHRAKEIPAMHALKAHLSREPALLYELMETLFNILLFESMSNNAANQWAVTRPILSLLLADEQVRGRKTGGGWGGWGMWGVVVAAVCFASCGRPYLAPFRSLHGRAPSFYWSFRKEGEGKEDGGS